MFPDSSVLTFHVFEFVQVNNGRAKLRVHIYFDNSRPSRTLSTASCAARCIVAKYHEHLSL